MIRIDTEKCAACGVCADVCPRHIPEIVEGDGRKTTVISTQRQGLCMECGHCTAVCPADAIGLDSFADQEFLPSHETGIEPEGLLGFLRQRRSVRRYQDKPVSRDVLDRILEGVHCAPTGTGLRSTGVIVIDNPDRLAEFGIRAMAMYETLGGQLRNPMARFIIKRRVGANPFGTLTDFVMPGMAWYLRWYKEGRGNEILRDCPALMLFHSPIGEPVGAENCLVAAFHGILAAQSLGVGTCFNDLIPPVCNRDPEARRLLGLPPEREVYASMTLGWPKYKYRKTPPRRLAQVRYLD